MENRDVEIVEKKETGLARLFAAVYGWMTFALLISALCAYAVGTTPNLQQRLIQNTWVWIGLVIVEFVLVIAISGMINKISAATATALFGLYAAVNGVTLAFVFIVYTAESIGLTFLITAATFGVTALIGTVTKKDLSSFGGILLMALIGLIIASLVNIFVHSLWLYWLITYAGILIFVGLTAYDAQKVKKMYELSDGTAETNRKIAVIGALQLYLDFVNLLLYMLRLFGKRR